MFIHGQSVPFSQGFCCSCNPRVNVENQLRRPNNTSQTSYPAGEPNCKNGTSDSCNRLQRQTANTNLLENSVAHRQIDKHDSQAEKRWNVYFKKFTHSDEETTKISLRYDSLERKIQKENPKNRPRNDINIPVLQNAYKARDSQSKSLPGENTSEKNPSTKSILYSTPEVFSNRVAEKGEAEQRGELRDEMYALKKESKRANISQEKNHVEAMNNKNQLTLQNSLKTPRDINPIFDSELNKKFKKRNSTLDHRSFIKPSESKLEKWRERTFLSDLKNSSMVEYPVERRDKYWQKSGKNAHVSTSLRFSDSQKDTFARYKKPIEICSKNSASGNSVEREERLPENYQLEVTPRSERLVKSNKKKRRNKVFPARIDSFGVGPSMHLNESLKNLSIGTSNGDFPLAMETQTRSIAKGNLHEIMQPRNSQLSSTKAENIKQNAMVEFNNQKSHNLHNIRENQDRNNSIISENRFVKKLEEKSPGRNYTPQKRTLKNFKNKNNDFWKKRIKKSMNSKNVNDLKPARRRLKRLRGRLNTENQRERNGFGKLKEKSRNFVNKTKIYIDYARRLNKDGGDKSEGLLENSNGIDSSNENGDDFFLENDINRQDSVDKQIAEKFLRISNALKEDSMEPKIINGEGTTEMDENEKDKATSEKFAQPETKSDGFDFSTRQENHGTFDESTVKVSTGNEVIEGGKSHKFHTNIPHESFTTLDSIRKCDQSNSNGALYFRIANNNSVLNERFYEHFLVNSSNFSPIKKPIIIIENVKIFKPELFKIAKIKYETSTENLNPNSGEFTKNPIMETTYKSFDYSQITKHPFLDKCRTNELNERIKTEGTLEFLQNGDQKGKNFQRSLTAFEEFSETTIIPKLPPTEKLTEPTQTTKITDALFQPSIKSFFPKKPEAEFHNEVLLDDTTFPDETDAPTSANYQGIINDSSVDTKLRIGREIVGKKRKSSSNQLENEDLSSALESSKDERSLYVNNPEEYEEKEDPTLRTDLTMQFLLQGNIDSLKEQSDVTDSYLYQAENSLGFSVAKNKFQKHDDLPGVKKRNGMEDQDEAESRDIDNNSASRDETRVHRLSPIANKVTKEFMNGKENHPWFRTTLSPEFTIREGTNFARGVPSKSWSLNNDDKSKTLKEYVHRKNSTNYEGENYTGRILHSCDGNTSNKEGNQGNGNIIRDRETYRNGRRLFSFQKSTRKMNKRKIQFPRNYITDETNLKVDVINGEGYRSGRRLLSTDEINCKIHGVNKEETEFYKNRYVARQGEDIIDEKKIHRNSRRLLSTKKSKLKNHINKKQAKNRRNKKSKKVRKDLKIHKNHLASKKRDAGIYTDLNLSEKNKERRKKQSSSSKDYFKKYSYSIPDSQYYPKNLLEDDVLNPETFPNYESITLPALLKNMNENSKLQDVAYNRYNPDLINPDTLLENSEPNSRTRSAVDKPQDLFRDTKTADGKDFEISLTGKVHLANDLNGKSMSISINSVPDSSKKDSNNENNGYVDGIQSPESMNSLSDTNIVTSDENLFPSSFSESLNENMQLNRENSDEISGDENSERSQVSKGLNSQMKFEEAGSMDENEVKYPKSLDVNEEYDQIHNFNSFNKYSKPVETLDFLSEEDEGFFDLDDESSNVRIKKGVPISRGSNFKKNIATRSVNDRGLKSSIRLPDIFENFFANEEPEGRKGLKNSDVVPRDLYTGGCYGVNDTIRIHHPETTTQRVEISEETLVFDYQTESTQSDEEIFQDEELESTEKLETLVTSTVVYDTNFRETTMDKEFTVDTTRGKSDGLNDSRNDADRLVELKNKLAVLEFIKKLEKLVKYMGTSISLNNRTDSVVIDLKNIINQPYNFSLSVGRRNEARASSMRRGVVRKLESSDIKSRRLSENQGPKESERQLNFLEKRHKSPYLILREEREKKPLVENVLENSVSKLESNKAISKSDAPLAKIRLKRPATKMAENNSKHFDENPSKVLIYESIFSTLKTVDDKDKSFGVERKIKPENKLKEKEVVLDRIEIVATSCTERFPCNGTEKETFLKPRQMGNEVKETFIEEEPRRNNENGVRRLSELISDNKKKSMVESTGGNKIQKKHITDRFPLRELPSFVNSTRENCSRLRNDFIKYNTSIEAINNITRLKDTRAKTRVDAMESNSVEDWIGKEEMGQQEFEKNQEKHQDSRKERRSKKESMLKSRLDGIDLKKESTARRESVFHPSKQDRDVLNYSSRKYNLDKGLKEKRRVSFESDGSIHGRKLRSAGGKENMRMKEIERRRKRMDRKVKEERGLKNSMKFQKEWPARRNLLMLSESEETLDGRESLRWESRDKFPMHGKRKKRQRSRRDSRKRVRSESLQIRGGQDCTDRNYPLNVDPVKYLESAHCLRFSDLWYSVYQLEEPVIDHKVHFEIYEKLASPDGSTFWNDLTEGSTIRLGTSDGRYINSKDTIAITYKEAGFTSRREYSLDFRKDRLLVPFSVSEETVESPGIEGWSGEYLVIEADGINEDGNECDKAGVGFAAFAKQPERCEHVRGTCLKNQPLSYWRHDMEARESGRGGCYFLSNFAPVPSEAIKYNVNGSGSREFLALEYHSPHVSVIDVELRADYNALPRGGLSGRLTEIHVDTTAVDYTLITILITNKASSSSSYRPRIIDCPSGLPASWSDVEGPTRIILPHRDRKITLELYGRLLLNEFTCTVELLNHHEEAVATRRMKVRKMDRCSCMWHCMCSCSTNMHGMTCQPMSLENYRAAGFRGPVPVTPVESSPLSSPVAIVSTFIVTLLLLLLFMGLLKWLIGFCIPPISRWGLNSLLKSTKMKEYFEHDLKCRCVTIDRSGVPVHPDTGMRTVRICSRKCEFLLNLIFFLIYPLAICHRHCKKPHRSTETSYSAGSKTTLMSMREDTPKMICVSTYGDGVNSKLEAEDTKYVINELKKSQESLQNHSRYKRHHYPQTPSPSD